MRIGVARLWHEANSFSATTTTMAAFRSREWARGDDVATLHAGAATEIGGALAWAAAHNDRALVFSRCASAPPGGPVEQPLLDAFIEEVTGDPALDGIDGLYLSLHGACLGTEDLAPEATLLEGLRRRFPDLPIAASFDLHACLSPAVTDRLDAATVYRTHPHLDMDAAAARALDLLATMIETGRRARVFLRSIGRVLPSFNMRTLPGTPMAEAEAFALALEREAPAGALFAAYPYASFAYADVESADAGAVVTAEDPAAGEAAAAALAAFLFARRGAFRPELASAAEVLADRSWEDRGEGGRRVAILEPSDNPLSGGQGDTPGLFAAALAADLPDGSVFAFFCDPPVVARAAAAGVGASLQLRLGGRCDARFGEPVSCTAEVLCVTDGRFVNAGPMERGLAVDLGPTALLKVGPLRVIVTTGCQSPNDIGYFRLHGLDLDDVPLLLAKAKNHFTAAFGAQFDAIILCETPGPAMAEVARLPFRRLPRARLSLE